MMLAFIGTVLTVSFLLSFIGLYGLHKLRSAQPTNFLKKYLYVSSGKSSTDAILLGGLPIALAIVVTTYATNHYFNIFDLSLAQKNILFRGMISATVLICYGHLDDKYELRPIAKLFFQVITVLMFTLTTTALLTRSQYSNIVFFLYSVTGMALINGNNLLDGLDTMAIKTNIAILSGYAFMGYYTQTPLVTTFSLSGIAALSAFYLFNKTPAKIYLGEIGGTFLGFSYLILMTLFQQNQVQKTNTIKLFFIAALPAVLPIMELFVSFSRRVMNNKSPFKADRLHMHYILTDNYKFSVSKATNIYSMINIAIISASLSAYFMFHIPIAAIITMSIAMWIGTNHFICRNYWSVSLDLSSPLHTVFNKMRKKDITLINVSDVDTFEFTLIHSDQDSVEENDKKAA
jgi:UDP-N-acetylmuramyl pentapeptide phosphotransferase/UDP-N-acetylglucosamine-1-phosphate transferase